MPSCGFPSYKSYWINMTEAAVLNQNHDRTRPVHTFDDKWFQGNSSCDSEVNLKVSYSGVRKWVKEWAYKVDNGVSLASECICERQREQKSS